MRLDCPFSHLNAYRFFSEMSEFSTELACFQSWLLDLSLDLGLKGTILLAPEGFNINVSGRADALRSFQDSLEGHVCFSGLLWHSTQAWKHAYEKMHVKIKKQIVTFQESPAFSKALAPLAQTLAPWAVHDLLTKQHAWTILDVRNGYETAYGLFKQSVDLKLNQFTDLPKALRMSKAVQKKKPVLIVCTGGIRCEKAGHFLLSQGYEAVYQIKGGILNYLSQCPSEHYQGHCFVFDNRVALDPALNPIDMKGAVA